MPSRMAASKESGGPDDGRSCMARAGEVTGAAQALDAYLQRIGVRVRAKERVVPLIWSRVVGEWYAEHTAVTRVTRRTVHVWCSSPALAHQLSLDARHILGRLNQRLGGEVLRELRPSTAGTRLSRAARQGNRAPLPTYEQLQATRLPREETAMVEMMCEILGERPLSEAFRRALVSARRSERWRREHGYQECAACGALFWGEERWCVVCRSQ